MGTAWVRSQRLFPIILTISNFEGNVQSHPHLPSLFPPPLPSSLSPFPSSTLRKVRATLSLQATEIYS